MRVAPLAAVLSCTALASPGLLTAQLSPAEHVPWAVAAAVDLRGWVGLQLHVGRELTHAPVPVSVGLELDLPVLLWARGGGLDTLGGAVRASAVPARVGLFELGVDVAVTGRTQASNVGRFGALGAKLTAYPALRWGRVALAVELAWEQPLFTVLTPSALVSATFADRPTGSSAAPGVAVWPFPFTRFHT